MHIRCIDVIKMDIHKYVCLTITYLLPVVPKSHIYTVKLVYNDTLGATKMCCYNQVVVVTRTFSTETIQSVPAMCVVVKRSML